MLARPATTSIDSRVLALCEEFSVEIVPKHQYPQPGQTRAVATIARIIDRHGAGHARLVLCALAEGRGNHALIDECSLWAISDLLLAIPDVVEDRTAALFDLLDQIPLGPLMAIANELSGIIPQRPALAGMLYLQMRQLRGGSITGKVADRPMQRRVAFSEAEKGRPIAA